MIDKPKFPTPVNLLMLLDYFYYGNRLESLFKQGSTGPEQSRILDQFTDSRSKHSVSETFGLKAQRSLEMAQFTAEKMAMGGIHDHVGSGFHRYSVDESWHVPHFEKMFYDQAQLLKFYSRLHKCGPDQATIIRDIVNYMSSALKSPQGAFYAAEDADSLPSLEDSEKKEGAFAVWEKKEIDLVLGSEELSAIFCFRYGVEEDGNVSAQHDPHGELTNKVFFL